ncbi:MAG: EAL domain-containing protein [Methylococcaceae bacterium]
MRSAGQVEYDSYGKPILIRGIVQDLTERNDNQQRIERLLAEQKAILDNRLVGIVTVRDSKIVWANPAFETMLGYEEGEVIGVSMQQFYVHQEDYQTVGEAYESIRNEGLIRTRLNFVCKDGRDIWVDMNGTILHKESDESLWVAIDVTERKQIETILREKEEYQRALLDNFPFSVWLKDTESRFLAVNQAFAVAVGENDPDTLIGKTEFDYLPKEIAEEHQTDDRSVLASRQKKTGEEEQVDHLGLRRWFETFKTPVVDDQGVTLGTVGFARDISSRKKIEVDLRIAATVFESHEAMLVSDANNVILRVNHAFSSINGYSADDVIGKNPSVLNSGRHDAEFFGGMWESINNMGAWKGELWNRRKNGTIYPGHLIITAVKDQNANVTNYVAMLTDITLSKAAADEIERLAFYDPLTQLPNRRLLQERLKHSIKVERRDGKHLGLLMLDLDRFKAVNDSLGHLAGDELLQKVGARITARLRDVDLVARLGGDEFVVLLEDIAQPEDAARVARAIITDLSKPFSLSQSEHVQIGASIGISLYPQHGDSPELLMDHADAALYKAKDDGRGCFAYFSEDLTLVARERMVVETRLRRALAQQELRVFYQPQVDIASGRIIGAEALVRWQDPIEGLIPPLRFIPIAEETGLIVEIGEWVLRETCNQGRLWLDSGLPPLTLAVNVSPQQFRRSDICALVATVLSDTGFPAQQLELEITESGLMGNQDKATAILNELRAQGVRLAIDDFGTGYSSLAYLKHFPLDVLKIDKSFIDDIPFHQDDMKIAATIIAMGRILGFKVLAEGVETAAQLDFLREKGCDLYQGYIKSKPVPADQFAALLRKE